MYLCSVKVSILVPVYGVEKYIEQCAVSLFEQTYEDIEYIFVDDCTPDNSILKLQSVLDRYPNRAPQVNIIRHDHNRGLGAARKTALASCTGDFVLNVDSDDFLSINAVELLVAQQVSQGADIVTGCIRIYRGDELSETLQVPHEDKKVILKLLLIHNTIPHNLCGRLIRKTLFTDNGISPEEGVNQAEDYAVTPRLFFCAKKVAFVDEPIYHYQVFIAGSFSDQISPRHVESFLRANDLVFSFLKQHDVQKDYQFALSLGMLETYYLVLKSGFSSQDILKICHYKPQGLFKMIHLLLAHKSTIKLLRFVYLTIKWSYKKHLHFAG